MDLGARLIKPGSGTGEGGLVAMAENGGGVRQDAPSSSELWSEQRHNDKSWLSAPGMVSLEQEMASTARAAATEWYMTQQHSRPPLYHELLVAETFGALDHSAVQLEGKKMKHLDQNFILAQDFPR